MARGTLSLRPGALVVLEGLDRTGKSTQVLALQSLNWADPCPIFTHMPSGLTDLTRDIYRLTENVQITSPLARQLLHLACHAENLGALAGAREARAVVLDRWWWSTVAYGWYGGRLSDLGVDETLFSNLIDTVWSSQSADVVFVFTTPYERDELNRDEVRAGYAHLADRFPALTVEVPSATPSATTEFILASLEERGLLQHAHS